MRAFAILTALALLSGASLAHAESLASPATYGSAYQYTAQCTIGKTGDTPIKATVKIVDEIGNEFNLNNGCFGPIEPHFICQAFANAIPYNQAVACVASVPGSAAKLRGSLTIYTAGGVPLRTSELR